MAEYIKICMRCIHSCKQRADMGLKMLKCPTFEQKIKPLANSKPSPPTRTGVKSLNG